MKTAVEQIIDEFNEELKVAVAIGNKDKIRIIKHLITIATLHLPKEKEQIIEARNNGFMASAEGWNGEYGIKDFNLLTEEIKSEEYFNKTFKTK